MNNSLEKYAERLTEKIDLQKQVSKELILELGGIFHLKGEPSNYLIELSISISSENVNLKDFTAYLSLIDRLYGRLSPTGLRSYSLSKNQQLNITEFRKGSLEIVFRFVNEMREVSALILIVMFLKSLPTAIKAISEGTKSLADAYKSYEEAKLTKTNREKLAENIEKEKSLEKLNGERKEELVTILEAMFIKEDKKLSSLRRFAHKYVKKIRLKAVSSKNTKN